MVPSRNLLVMAVMAATATSAALAADIVMTPPAGGGVVVTNAAGNATRFRVADDGVISIPGLAAAPLPASGLCVEGATGKVGTCSVGMLTSIVAGAGLSGGTITTTGTIGIADGGVGTAQIANGAITPAKFAAKGCEKEMVYQFNGEFWVCATLAAPSGGTVTSVATGSGLTGGTITTAGTIGLAATQLLPTAACATNQVPKWSGSAWTCAADDGGPAAAFVAGGNAFGATALLGTTDDQALSLVANNKAAFRIVPNANGPALVGGFEGNSVTAGLAGATVAGGGTRGNIFLTDPISGRPCRSFVGCFNLVTGHGGTVSGGASNQAGNDTATLSDSNYATVSGGFLNTASGENSSVGGGSYNTASGLNATVPGGNGNTALGPYSFAAGRNARASNAGCFTWADSTDISLSCTTDNAFVARASGGVFLFTSGNLSTGAQLPAGGGSWANLSDVNAKADFASVDARTVLAKVAALPIRSWRYKTQDASVRHIGPTAQDFHAAFAVGESNRMITSVDADGVALAAIQGLHQLLADRDRRIDALEGELAAIKRKLGL
ncbi:MAG: tail fiber domain-containing protein [Betaproteobacteria bacterium]|nr:tail fiber domain-containing protein [Betaproteobacteria bacterium]